jgi:hypothetical protein
MGVSNSVVTGLLIFSTAFPVAILFVVLIITVGEHIIEKRQRRSDALNQAPNEAPKYSEVEHVVTQQQPPTNPEDALRPNEPQGQQDEPKMPVVLQRPAWFEGEQDGRRFYFHEPSGRSQWDPPNEPCMPFTPTMAAAPFIVSTLPTAPQIQGGDESNAVAQQTALEDKPDDPRNF